ncbi:MAG: hypothetical protein KR126chlam2_00337 [Chlamydiae bacterium]|nr:hypothetical protein [Chlamydiota bacterium]
MLEKRVFTVNKIFIKYFLPVSKNDFLLYNIFHMVMTNSVILGTLRSSIKAIASNTSDFASGVQRVSRDNFGRFRAVTGPVCSKLASEAKLAATVFNNHKRDVLIFAVATAGIVVGMGVLYGITGGASWAGIEHGLKVVSVPWSIGIGSGLAVGFISGVIWATIYKPYNNPTREKYPPHNTLYEYGFHWYDQVKSSATKGVLTTLGGYLVIAAGSVYPTALSLLAGIVGGNYIGVHLIYEMNVERAKKDGKALFKPPAIDDKSADGRTSPLILTPEVLSSLAANGQTVVIHLSQTASVTVTSPPSDESKGP